LIQPKLRKLEAIMFFTFWDLEKVTLLFNGKSYRKTSHLRLHWNSHQR